MASSLLDPPPAAGMLDRIRSSRVRRLHDYWCAKRGDRLLPGRDDIDPAEIRELLPYLAITDVYVEPIRVRFRLVGTALTQAAGYNYTGMWLHDLQLDAGLQFWLKQYVDIIRLKRAIFSETQARLPSGATVRFESAVFPLASDGVTVDKTIEIEDWEGIRRLSDDAVKDAVWTVVTL